MEKCENVVCAVKPIHCQAYLKYLLTRQLNAFIKQYYQVLFCCLFFDYIIYSFKIFFLKFKFFLVCEDSICVYRTKRISCKFANYKPMCVECDKNAYYLEYPHADLYYQLRYFKYLFDVESYKSTFRAEFKMNNADYLCQLKDLKEFVMNKLKKNSCGFVKMKSLFCF